MSLIKKLLKLNRTNFTHFTTPSHAQKPLFKTLLGKHYFKMDYSEIDYLDNLNNPQDCILELENELSEIYNSGFTHILTNGSTQGILALMLAVLSKNDKVLCAYNCHKAIHNGLVLTGAEPIWVYPNYNTEYGVYGSISAQTIESAILNNPDARCLIITNPTYDGAISDIAKISEICKNNNLILIVDEAHGALWNFDKTLGIPAILAGADASVQSLHKTCGAITPSALLHLSKNSKIPKERIMSALNIISTTSPSFALMTNVEETIKFLNSKRGKKTIEKLVENISQTIYSIKKLKNIEILHTNNDITKIQVRPLKMTAQEVNDILYNKFKIECEVQHSNSLTFLCGIGTTSKALKKLISALKYINKISKNNGLLDTEIQPLPEREMAILPQNAYSSIQKDVLAKDSIGKISADIITTYPPGIPLITYGERIKESHLNFISEDIKIRIVN